MKHLKTYEGIFDFLKKKKEIDKEVTNKVTAKEVAKEVVPDKEVEKEEEPVAKEVQKKPEPKPKKTAQEILREVCGQINMGGRYSFIENISVGRTGNDLDSSIWIKITDEAIKHLSNTVPVKSAQISIISSFSEPIDWSHRQRQPDSTDAGSEQKFVCDVYNITMELFVKFSDSEDYQHINMSLMRNDYYSHMLRTLGRYDRGETIYSWLSSLLNSMPGSMHSHLQRYVVERDQTLRREKRQKKFREVINEDVLTELFIDFIDLSENTYNISPDEYKNGYYCQFTIKDLRITPQKHSASVGRGDTSGSVEHTFNQSKFPLNSKNGEVLGLLSTVEGRMKDINDDVRINVTMATDSITFHVYVDHSE